MTGIDERGVAFVAQTVERFAMPEDPQGKSSIERGGGAQQDVELDVLGVPGLDAGDQGA
jgi:hypothetical protein